MSVLSLRYAHAFASVAASSHLDTAAAQQQLNDFNGTLSGSHELREVLMNPSIANEQKLKVLDAIAGRIGMFPQVRNFLAGSALVMPGVVDGPTTTAPAPSPTPPEQSFHC